MGRDYSYSLACILLNVHRKKIDERDVLSTMEVINAFINPWTYEGEELVSLVTGVVAPEKAKEDMLGVAELGESQASDFLSDRALSDIVGFHSPLTRNNIATFGEKRRKVTKDKQRAVIQKNDISLFSRLLILSKSSRDINIREILSYPLHSVSLPLSSADGSLCKTVKSSLIQAIENDCTDFLLDTGISDAIMIDAMAMVQSLPNAAIPSTFGRLGDMIFQLVVTLVKQHGASRADFVIDCYYEQSIKDSERIRRTSQSSRIQTLHINNGEVKVPSNWKSFLSSPINKTNLLKFLHSHWSTCSSSYRFTLFSTTQTGCEQYQFSGSGVPQVTVCNDLESDHEEADTRLIAHAYHASKLGMSVLICSPDTDVYILSIVHSSKFDNLKFLTGCGERKRIVNVKTMATDLGSEMCGALIGLHAFTGCDAVSAFSGKGKKTPYRLVKNHELSQQACKGLGEQLPLDDEVLLRCKAMTCALYGDEEKTDINDVRYRSFCTKTSDSSKLPPCAQSLKQHCNRANYVSKIWKSAHNALMEIPSPIGHGWTSDIKVHWFDGPEASPALVQLTSCNCKKGCGAHCSCRKSKFACSDICKCGIECLNISSEEQSDDISDEENND